MLTWVLGNYVCTYNEKKKKEDGDGMLLEHFFLKPGPANKQQTYLSINHLIVYFIESMHTKVICNDAMQNRFSPPQIP